MPDHHALPPDVTAPVRAYLGAFLSPEAVDEAVDEVAADSGFWGDTARTEVLAVAHTVLRSRLRVATDVEVLVLNEDVGLSVPEIAAVLGLPAAQVRGILDEALAVIADVDTVPPAVDAPTGPVAGGGTDPATAAGADARDAGPPVAGPAHRGRPRPRPLVLAAALVVVAVALAAAWMGARDDGCPRDASLCVTDSALTDAVDPATGAPRGDRSSFALGEPVTLWFSFERQAPTADPLEVRWFRDGVLLYATDVRPGSGDRLNVSLAGLWSDQPGRYRVEVSDGGHLLLGRDFRIEG